jgi:hypothetical protein
MFFSELTRARKTKSAVLSKVYGRKHTMKTRSVFPSIKPLPGVAQQGKAHACRRDAEKPGIGTLSGDVLLRISGIAAVLPAFPGEAENAAIMFGAVLDNYPIRVTPGFAKALSL